MFFDIHERKNTAKNQQNLYSDAYGIRAMANNAGEWYRLQHHFPQSCIANQWNSIYSLPPASLLVFSNLSVQYST